MSFDQLGLSEQLLEAIDSAGYKEPTPIQAQAIPAALSGRDVLGIAQTGTGKTASFTLPMIEMLAKGQAKARMPRSLILEPTRELAAQVAENFHVYGKNHKLNMALLIGGVSFDEQEQKLDRGVDVLIATPGRLIDHFERGKVLLTGVKVLVVDEADRMLDMGFIPDIERIFRMTPFTRQTLFFSATMPNEIRKLTDTFLSNPLQIEVARAATTAEKVTQVQVHAPKTAKDKRALLRRVLSQDEVSNAIVFCNRKRDVGIVADSLKRHGFPAAPLHGDLDQSVRTRTLDNFRQGEVKILVASDVAARGLDIPDVSHIVNYDVPTHPEDYVHRIGRTGRAGREGKAVTLVTKPEGKYLAAIVDLIGKDIAVESFGGSDAKPSADESAGDDRSRKGRSRSRGGRKGGAKADKAADKPKADAAQPKTDKVMDGHVPAFLLRPTPLTSAAE